VGHGSLKEWIYLGEGCGMPQVQYPTTLQERIPAYMKIMEEIKVRVQMIEHTKGAGLPFSLAREVCFLQLRHMVELIAIGCLAAQGKLTGSKALLVEDNPNRIFRELDKYFPYGFPQAATPKIEAQGGEQRWVGIVANDKPSALTRREALQMWADSGNYLHRLTVKKFFSPETAETDPWNYIDTHVAKTKDLLRQHIITSPEQKGQMIFVSMFANRNLAEASVLTFDLEKHVLVDRVNFEFG
jgi:hypothetical protein